MQYKHYSHSVAAKGKQQRAARQRGGGEEKKKPEHFQEGENSAFLREGRKKQSNPLFKRKKKNYQQLIRNVLRWKMVKP